jgi:hypothetical protein
MATVASTLVSLPNLVSSDRVTVAKWTPLTFSGTDDGVPLVVPGWTERTVQVFGTFGAGGSVRIEGSIDGGVTYGVLTDPQGNALDITAAKLETITEAVTHIRPRVTAGDGTTSLTVLIFAKG